MNFLEKTFQIGGLRFYETLIHKVIHSFCGWKTQENNYQKKASKKYYFFNNILE